VSSKCEAEALTPSLSFWFQTFLAVLRRPALWWTTFRQILRVARGRWWSRPPFLPVPDRRYLRFRLETAYGTSRATAGTRSAADVVRYLEWCRASERAS
jgi:hypothetical protein